jgi:hypothetical protein
MNCGEVKCILGGRRLEEGACWEASVEEWEEWGDIEMFCGWESTVCEDG